MAKIKFIHPQPKSKRCMRLVDCFDGDIVIIPDENSFGIIIGADGDKVKVFNIEEGETYYFEESTCCKKFIGTLQFDPVNDFEEFCE